MQRGRYMNYGHGVGWDAKPSDFRQARNRQLNRWRDWHWESANDFKVTQLRGKGWKQVLQVWTPSLSNHLTLQGDLEIFSAEKSSTFYLLWQTVLVKTNSNAAASQKKLGHTDTMAHLTSQDKRSTLFLRKTVYPGVGQVPEWVYQSIQELAHLPFTKMRIFSPITASTFPFHCHSIKFPFSLPSHLDC